MAMATFAALAAQWGGARCRLLGDARRRLAAHYLQRLDGPGRPPQRGSGAGGDGVGWRYRRAAR
jgi:hypothetical protein